MKSFKNYLTELSGPSHQDLAVDKNMNPAAFMNPEVLRKINAWVGTVAQSPYVLPEEAVATLRNSLMKIGLTFDAIDESSYPTEEGATKDVSLPLTLFGGRFGKDVDTPIDEFVNDDGISHNVEGGLSLNLEFKKMGDGTTFVGAKIA